MTLPNDVFKPFSDITSEIIHITNASLNSAGKGLFFQGESGSFLFFQMLFITFTNAKMEKIAPIIGIHAKNREENASTTILVFSASAEFVDFFRLL